MKKIGLFFTAALFCFGTMTMIQSCSKPCKDEPCDQGTCVEADKDYTCDCDAGYEGELCDELMVTKFLGSYVASDDCAANTYNGTITASGSTVDKILISDFGKYGCNSEWPTIEATVVGTDLTIVDLTNCPGAQSEYTVKGTGSINAAGTVITINYNGTAPLSDGGGAYSCVATLTLQ